MAGLAALAAGSLSAGHDRPASDPGAAAATRPVKDLNPAATPVTFLQTSELVPLGDAAYFLGGAGGNRFEAGLWVTDGSASGTRMVRAMPLQDDTGQAYGLVTAGGRLFFFAPNGGWESYLWTSDGTAEGTRPLVPSGNGFVDIPLLVPVGARVFFLRYPATGIDVALWMSDGTPEGTLNLHAFSQPNDVYSVGNLCAWGDRLAFKGWDATHGSELWVSDGTPGGTRMFKDLVPGGAGSGPASMIPWRSCLFFAAAEGEYGPWRIWASDGTETGTTPIPDSPQLYGGDAVLLPCRNILYFWAYTAEQPAGLWRTDAKPGGTMFIKALELGGGTAAFRAEISSDTLLFNGYDPGYGYELWRSDGTPDGTGIVRDICEGVGSSWPYGLTALGGAVYFSGNAEGSGRELWRSDGTGAGTVLVRDIHEGAADSSPDWLQAWKGRLWFQADDGSHGAELWTSDGTGEGTRLLANLAADVGSSTITSLIPWGAGGAILEAVDGTLSYRFWASDGTPEETQPFLTLDPAVNWRPPGELASRGDLVFFPLFSTPLGVEMWSTDGSTQGTNVVLDIIPGPADSVDSSFQKGAFLGADYFFSGSDGVHGLEPWATDGTAAGTRMAADLCTEPDGYDPTASSWPGRFIADSGRLFFTARGDEGNEGWYAIDRAARATRLLASFDTPSDQITFLSPAIAGTTAFLFTQEQQTDYQWDLWRSDGTPEGTASIASLYVWWKQPWTPGPLFPYRGRVFFSASRSWDGAELWISDGTSGGTGLFRDVNPGEGGSYPADFAALGDRFYFRADDGVHGAELWTSDGTKAGTFMLKDLCPGLGSGFPMDLASDGERIVFSATDGLHGHELWVSDGTPEGTQMAADIRPGAASSMPERFTPSGSTIYYSADDGRTGRELWRYDPL